MVGMPDNFIFSQAGTVFFHPASHPNPRNDGIEQSTERVNGKLSLTGNRTEITLRHKTKTMLGGL